MPHPMQNREYEAWVAHVDAHPEEKAVVIEAIERCDGLSGRLTARPQAPAR